MKIRYFLYAIVAFLVGVSLACFVGYATDTWHSNAPKQQVPVETTSAVTTTVAAEKKKNCGCCAERRERLREQIRKARERKNAVGQARTTLHSP